MEYELKDGENKELSNSFDDWAVRVERKGNFVYVFKREHMQSRFRFYTWMSYEKYCTLVDCWIHNGDIVSAFFDPFHQMDMEWEREPTPVTDFIMSFKEK